MLLDIVVPPLDFHLGQRQILKHPARFKTIRCGRRFGKTMLSAEWLSLMDGGALDGWPVAFFSPTYKLLLDVWDDMKRTLAPISKSNKSDMRITLETGGKIDFWTLEDPDAGRGRKYKRLVVDEAAHARHLKEAWEKAISPTLTDYHGDAWFISTPKGINYFHELDQKGLDPERNDWASFHFPTSANPHISPEEIERYRQDLPELVFRQEYLAEFVTFGAGMVSTDMIIPGPYPAHLRPAMGVDLAISQKETADFSAIATMGKGPDYFHLKEIERFRLPFHQILERIKQAAHRHEPGVILVEETQFQAAVVQELLRTTTLPIVGVKPDRDKVTRFAPLLTRYERHLVRHDPSGVPAWFRDELLSFPEGEHKDGVDAAAYAFIGCDRIESIRQPLTARIDGI